MNLLKKIAICLLVYICCQACTKELILDLSKEKNKIVINGLINNTEPLSATITKSFLIYEDSTILELSNAAVKIYEDDVFVENMVYQKTPEMDIGTFTASFLPQIGASYRISTNAEGLTDATGTGIVPVGVDIGNVSVKFGGGNAYPFSFTLKDPTEKNYYYLKMFFPGYSIDSLTQTRIEEGPFAVEIPEGALPEAQRYLSNGYIFKDDGFDGNAITISGIAKAGSLAFSSSNLGIDNNKGILLDTSHLFIRLETLSEDAYKFYNSNAIPLQHASGFLTESSSVYGNVENGLGLFAGIYVSEVGVEVEQ